MFSSLVYLKTLRMLRVSRLPFLSWLSSGVVSIQSEWAAGLACSGQSISNVFHSISILTRCPSTVFAGYFMYFKDYASGWPLLCQLQVQQRLLELPRANRWSANLIKKHVAHHLQDFVNLHVHSSLAADFRWHKHGQQVPSWVCFCLDSARPFECVWRFDPGADIGLPAENLSSSLSTTCLKFLSFEKVWNWWQTQVIGPQAASPTRALNEANLLRSNGANWSAKASSLLKQRNQEPKKLPKHYSCINEVLSTNRFASSFAPSCHAWLQFSEASSAESKRNGVCLTYGPYSKQCHDPHSYPAYSVQ